MTNDMLFIHRWRGVLRGTDEEEKRQLAEKNSIAKTKDSRWLNMTDIWDVSVSKGRGQRGKENGQVDCSPTVEGPGRQLES